MTHRCRDAVSFLATRFLPALLAGLISGPLTGGRAAAQDEGTWKVYLYGNEVNTLAARGEEIWAGTTGGVTRLEEDGVITQWNRTPQGLLSDSVITAAVDASGRLWLGTQVAGISIFDPPAERWRPFTTVLAPIPSDAVQRIRFCGPAESETLLVGTAKGYAIFVNQDLRFACQEGYDLCDLASYDVRDLLRSGGETWLATAEGVTVQKDDGSWVDRSTGIGRRPLTLLARADSLYAGSSAGLWTWRGDHWSQAAGYASLFARGFRLSDLVAAGDTLYLAGVGDTLGLADRGGVWRRLGGSLSRVGSGYPRDCTALARTRSGRLFAGAVDPGERFDGIYAWSGGSWVPHRLAGPSNRAHYRAAAFDAQGALWLSSAQKGNIAPLLSRYRAGEWSFYNGASHGRPGSYGMGLFDLGEDLWVAHCCCNNPEGFCPLERVEPAGPKFGTWPLYNIWDMDRDAQGNLWVASYHDNDHLIYAHGVTRINVADSTWIQVTQDTERNLISDQVRAVRVQDRYVWLGYDHDGVSRWDLGADGVPRTSDDLWRHFVQSDETGSLIGNSVRRIAIGSDGQVWIGTTAGISIYDGTKFRSIGPGYGRLPTAEVNALVTTDDGGAWVATKEGGLTRMARRSAAGFTYTVYGPPNLPNPNIEAMTLGPDGQVLWLATARGLASFRPPGQTTAAAGLLGVYPNPLFLPCLQQGKVDGVRLTGTGGSVRGVVTDLAGQIVARFPDRGGNNALLDPKAIIWDGRRHGQLAVPGVYWIRVQTPRGIESIGLAVIDAACTP